MPKLLWTGEVFGEWNLLLTQQNNFTLIKFRFAMKTTTNFDAISNRLKKRYRHLAKWAKGQRIDYFRLYDRDLPEAPLVIDALPNHWVIWVTEHVATNEGDVLDQVKHLPLEHHPQPPIQEQLLKSKFMVLILVR